MLDIFTDAPISSIIIMHKSRPATFKPLYEKINYFEVDKNFS